MPIRELDGTVLRMVKDIFEDYRQRGIIITGTFEDMSWTLTNEAKNVGLAMLSFEGGTKKAAMSWIGCTYPQYVKCVKAYILLNLGELSLDSLQELVRFLNRLSVTDSENVAQLIEYGTHIVSLLQLIPGGNERRDAVIADLEERMEQRVWRKKTAKQRRLADFKSYLRFQKVLSNFWRHADERQKLFYFPLYFWWNLTAILPLRPMELLLMPRNCLFMRNGENIITVRRTKLKGGKEKIGYSIADDYKLHEYVVNTQLAEELLWYMKSTEAMRQTEINTLFLTEPHFDYIAGKGGVWRSRYYSYDSLNTCRRYFYNEVVKPQGEDISEIRLGDTRHIAMTNLILSGGSPVVCRELAGHSNIDISSHYYSNISNLVECMTLERFRKSRSAETMISGSSKYYITKPQDAQKVYGGLCTSAAYKDGEVSDCLKCVGNNGNIGDCRYCSYYLPDNPGFMLEFNDDKFAKAQLDADCKYLICMIELVRKGFGYTEDIKTALLRLQHSGDRYGKCLLEEYSKEGGA